MKLWLEEIGNNGWWQIRVPIPKLPILEHTNVCYDEDKIYAVDPPGGPFISLGFCVNQYTVKEIQKTDIGIFLKLEKVIIKP